MATGSGARAWQFLKRNDEYAEARRVLADGAPGYDDAAPRLDRGRRHGARWSDPIRGAAKQRITRLAGAVRVAAVAGVAVVAGTDVALATTDTTFGDPVDTVQDIVGGTGGQLAAALAVGAALVGSVLRFNAMQLMGAVGVGIAAGAGTGIVTGLVGPAIVCAATSSRWRSGAARRSSLTTAGPTSAKTPSLIRCTTCRSG